MCGGHTHKSLNGNNFATPPRTTNTATAKFTMRLCNVLVINQVISKLLCEGAAQLYTARAPALCSSPKLQVYSQDVGEVHGGGLA